MLLYDVQTGLITTRLTGLDDISDIAFALDGTYYLSYDRGRILERRAGNDVVMWTTMTGGFSDSIMVDNTTPAPAAWLITLVAGGILSVKLRSRVLPARVR